MNSQLSKFVGIYNGKRIEVEACDLWGAKKLVVSELKVPMSKWGLVSVMCVESKGQEVIHSTASI